MDTRRVDGGENERENEHEILIARCVQDLNIKMYFMCKIQIRKARTKIKKIIEAENRQCKRRKHEKKLK